MRDYKLGSLFDGSGGFPLAGSLCGITPVWAAEVEPYPIAVTRSRFPNMKHLGDISKVHGGEIEPVDIITFGSPCQDLSVAGKRAGLKHEANGDEETTRSGLFMEAVRIIKQMRETTNGVYPRFALWENVPGAFSSNKGEDFRTVLEELIKVVEPEAVMPAVPAGGWPYADCYIGDGWSLAYRVFDAQYWGVPQRRRRIHLIVDFRGECAGKVLFEREGLRGYFAQGGTPWQSPAAHAQDCAGADDRSGAESGASSGLLDAVGLDLYNLAVSGDKAVSLTTSWNATGSGPTIAYSIENHPADSRVSIDATGKVQTLTSRMGTGGGNAPMVMEAIPIHDKATRYKGGGPTRNGDGAGNGLGVGAPGAPSPTLSTADRHIVCYGIGNGQANQSYSEEVVGALNCMHDQQAVAMPVVFDKEVYQSGQNATGGHYIAEGGPAPTLRTTGSPPGVAIQYIVRRLTPTECARLQGFADLWGHPDKKDDFTDEEYRFWCEVVFTKAQIDGTAAYNEELECYTIRSMVKPDKKKGEEFEPYWKDTGKPYKHKTKEQLLVWYNKLHTDSAEYKMWGNGIAAPPAIYCMQGIVDALESGAKSLEG